MKLTGSRIYAKSGAYTLLPINKIFPPFLNISFFVSSWIQLKLTLVVCGTHYLEEKLSSQQQQFVKRR